MAPRFKALRLHLSSHSMYTLGFRDHRTLQVDAEILRIHIETHQAINRRSSYSAFQNSPSLRDFTLICAISFDPAFLRFSLPWAQLTHLHIDEHLFFASMTILVRCVNLVDCTFGRLACFEEDEDVAIHERTTFPSLADAYFSFDSLDNDTTKNFLAPLILPALKKIALRSIAVVTLWGDVACAAFGSFQMRSGFNLETLELHGVNISAINLLPFLESLPALKSLKMTNIVNVYAFFRAITNDGSQYLLPQLKQLTVTFSPADNLLEAFIAMIRSRRGQSQATAAGMPAVSQLEYLHLISDKTTLPLDRWWWEWKLGILFPELELKCS
ncbi:hypothetical protein C8R44DRAFT_729756 [Mycena epipterygia]|nr:hypothetical protein C8R44DRAFT_729756 [Mycena epipterygia]